MSSFFDAAEASKHRHHASPLDLSVVARKILHPKKMVRPVKPRGSGLGATVFTVIGFGIFAFMVLLANRGAEYGAQAAMFYLTGGMSAAFLVALLILPTRLWYSLGFFTFFKDMVFGMIAMGFTLALLTQDLPYPSWFYDVNTTVPVHRQYKFALPTDKEIDFLTRVIYGEARGETPYNQSNIVHTIINRAENPKKRYGATIGEILIRPKAFSCLNPDDPNYPKLLMLDKKSLTFKKIRAIVVNTIVARMNGAADPTQGSTHYHTAEVDPHWNRKAVRMIKLGGHQFWTGVDD